MKESVLAAPFLTVKQLAEMWGTNVTTILSYAKRRTDPLPIRYIEGKTRGGFLSTAEVEAWVARNTVLHDERVEASLAS